MKEGGTALSTLWSLSVHAVGVFSNCVSLKQKQKQKKKKNKTKKKPLSVP